MILTEQVGDVVTLRLDNAPAMNAISAEMAGELHVKLLQAGRQARAIVLAGHERAFCAGVNLAPGSRPAGDAGAGASPLETVFNPLIRAIKGCPVPVISAVRGVAAGVGASLALSCDMIVAGESAYFLQAFRRIGLVPDGGSAFLLAQSVGRVRAMELMLLGEKLPAATALTWGLINRVVADADVEAEAAGMAASLAAGPTLALGLIRKSAWAALTNTFEAQLAQEADYQRDAASTQDHAEGVAAFLGKRPAIFVGS
jgi:2-(1,2-epoxy-1,2-dihydrophenyl)acetyl-CoA isomerase